MSKPEQRLSVWVQNRCVGELKRTKEGVVFTYAAGCSADDAISLTMPIDIAPIFYTPQDVYRQKLLHPIFDMNLPEGALAERFKQQQQKIISGFDDFDLLSLVGHSLIGRVVCKLQASDFFGYGEKYGEYYGGRIAISEEIALLKYKEGFHLFEELTEKYLHQSGVSGAQPKLLIIDEKISESHQKISRLTDKKTTHLVKAWGEEYPQLAANEFFCLRAAQAAGLTVPTAELSEDGRLLYVERFDINENGYLGFEDFCVLNGYSSAQKYEGSYENIAKRIKNFVSPVHQNQALADFFKILALSCALKNGDAHLKNFGVLYQTPETAVYLAPAYDIVTTTVYVKNDILALTLNGTKRWPHAKMLMNFACQHCQLSKIQALKIINEVNLGMNIVREEVISHQKNHPDFTEIGEKMLAAWDAGIVLSLKNFQ